MIVNQKSFKNDAIKKLMDIKEQEPNVTAVVEKERNLAMQAVKQFDFKLAYAMSLFTLTVDYEYISEFECFVIASILKMNLKKYFTDIEIKEFSTSKFNAPQLNKKLVYDVVCIGENQYLYSGKLDEFIQLREAQLIRYNPRTQRPLTKVTNGKTEYYIPTVNMSRANQIADLMLEGNYFPTPIILNIPQGDEEDNEFEYDDIKNKLIISKINTFDIVDGQHRNVAMGLAKAKNPDFNYYCPIIFTTFTENQCRQYIFQMDQKEHMSKIDSKSYDQSTYATQIINLIKGDNNYGQLINVKGVIPEQALNYIISNKIAKKQKLVRSDMVKYKKEIISDFDKLVDEIPNIFDKALNPLELITYLACAETDKISKQGVVLKQIKADLKGARFENQKWVWKSTLKIAKES